MPENHASTSKPSVPPVTMESMRLETEKAATQLENMRLKPTLVPLGEDSDDDRNIKTNKELIEAPDFITSAQGVGTRYLSLYPEKPQQDAMSCRFFDNANTLPAEQMGQILQDIVLTQGKEAHDKAETDNLYNQSGSTLISSVVRRTDANNNMEILTPNVGDSRAFVITKEGDQFVCRPLNYLHKPDDPTELQRITNEGGVVFEGYLNNKLAMTRSIGDGYVGNGLSYEPGISYMKVSAETPEAYLILCSDGITDELNELAITELFNNPVTKEKMFAHPNGIADYLRQRAYKGARKQEKIDNMSIIVIDLVKTREMLNNQTMIVTVADGHGRRAHTISQALVEEFPSRFVLETEVDKSRILLILSNAITMANQEDLPPNLTLRASLENLQKILESSELTIVQFRNITHSILTLLKVLQNSTATSVEKTQAIKTYTEQMSPSKITPELTSELKTAINEIVSDAAGLVVYSSLKTLQTLLTENNKTPLQDSLNQLESEFRKENGITVQHCQVLDGTLQLLGELQDPNLTLERKVQTVERYTYYAQKVLQLPIMANELRQATEKIVNGAQKLAVSLFLEKLNALITTNKQILLKNGLIQLKSVFSKKNCITVQHCQILDSTLELLDGSQNSSTLLNEKIEAINAYEQIMLERGMERETVDSIKNCASSLSNLTALNVSIENCKLRVLQDRLKNLRYIWCRELNEEKPTLQHCQVLDNTLQFLTDFQGSPEQKIKAVEDYVQKMLPLQAKAGDLWKTTCNITLVACALLLLAIAAKILFTLFLPALPALLVTAVVVGLIATPFGVSGISMVRSAASSTYAFFKATPMDDAIEMVALEARRLAEQKTSPPDPDNPAPAPESAVPVTSP
ncbi:MAG: PP2C family protein-serine/threonine phosphatase [Gammaproteobacteria bacterium]